MSHRRAWTNYDPDYRASEMRTLAGWIAAGHSGSVVGLSGAGKSNLLGFLSHRPDVLADYLPEDVRAVVVLVDLNSLPTLHLATLYRLLLRSFQDARGQLDGALAAEAERVFDAQLNERDPFVVQTELYRWLAQLSAAGMHVAFVMDRFDRFAGRATPELTGSLRALRDAFKGQLSYLAGMRLPVAYLPDPTVLGELEELLDTRVCWVGPMCGTDARRMVTEETDHAATPGPGAVDALLRLTGGYPALLKAACHWWLDTGRAVPAEHWADALAALPAVRTRIDEIWDGLTRAEQAALGAAASAAADASAPSAGRRIAQHADALALLAKKGLIQDDTGGSVVPCGTLLARRAAAEAGRQRGRLSLDADTGEPCLGATPLRELTNLERAALRYLLARPRARVPKSELIEGVWPDDVIEGGVMDDALYQVVRGIRRAIEPEPGKPRYLVTWRGRPEGGYQLFPEGRPEPSRR